MRRILCTIAVFIPAAAHATGFERPIPQAQSATAEWWFFAGLIAPWFGLPVLPPVPAVIGGCVLGIPVTWFFARHIKSLMTRADARQEDCG